MKKCYTCKKDLPIDKYHSSKSNKDGMNGSCKKCVASYGKQFKHTVILETDFMSYTRAKAQDLNKYGLTVEQHYSLLVKQDFKCACCGVPFNNEEYRHKPVVDHDHATGEVRELLCNHCNIGIGHFNDDYALLTKATAYLKKHLPNS